MSDPIPGQGGRETIPWTKTDPVGNNPSPDKSDSGPSPTFCVRFYGLDQSKSNFRVIMRSFLTIYILFPSPFRTQKLKDRAPKYQSPVIQISKIKYHFLEKLLHDENLHFMYHCQGQKRCQNIISRSSNVIIRSNSNSKTINNVHFRDYNSNYHFQLWSIPDLIF